MCRIPFIFRNSVICTYQPSAGPLYAQIPLFLWDPYVNTQTTSNYTCSDVNSQTRLAGILGNSGFTGKVSSLSAFAFLLGAPKHIACSCPLQKWQCSRCGHRTGGSMRHSTASKCCVMCSFFHQPMAQMSARLQTQEHFRSASL